MMLRAALLSLLCLSISATNVFAQGNDSVGEDREDTTGSKAVYELGAHLGNLLPNQVSGISEITGLGGVRAGFRFAPMTYAEGGIIMGNGSGASWKNVHADVRIDMPVENLVGMAYVGVDTVYYEGTDHNARLIFGGHAGGGIQAHLSGNMWFRSDMKFGFSPGTSLYVGFGFSFRFDGK